jgi:hypothetical protein
VKNNSFLKYLSQLLLTTPVSSFFLSFCVLVSSVLQFNFLTGSMPESICDLREDSELRVLFSDCGGLDPEIECEFPKCCNRCYEGGNSIATGRRKLTGYSSETRISSTSRYAGV